MTIKNLNKFMGKPIEGALEKVLGGLNEKSQPNKITDQTQKNIVNKQGYIFVPSAAIYIAKERTHLNLDWYKTHEVLHKEGLRMPTIPEFISFINYLRTDYQSIDKKEANQIFDDILKVGEWRGNWLDAKFENKKGKFFINYNHHIIKGKLVPKNSEPLADCLMEDCWADIFNSNSQGLPTKKLGSSYQQGTNAYYWYPRNEAVAGFGADSGGAGLSCVRDPSSSGHALGVFACAEGTQKNN